MHNSRSMPVQRRRRRLLPPSSGPRTALFRATDLVASRLSCGRHAVEEDDYDARCVPSEHAAAAAVTCANCECGNETRKVPLGALRWCLTVGVSLLLCATCSTGDPDRYSQVKETHNGTYLSQYEWSVRDMYALLQRSSVMHGVNLAGPDFYTGKPGYRVRLGLSFGRINPSNGVPYMGVWFTILRGRYDDALEWPFQYRFNITVVDPSGLGQDAHVSMNPMTAICRLRKQFQRPTERRNDGVEGCGKSFLIPHSKVLGYVSDDTLQLVSEFQWAVDDIDAKIKQARKADLSTRRTNTWDYSPSSFPGEFDDTLEWPLSYSFELSIVDQSAGFLTCRPQRRDRPDLGCLPAQRVHQTTVPAQHTVRLPQTRLI
ncbi:hypothetical protein MRX96_029782 [Rhipicephalus microplus]